MTKLAAWIFFLIILIGLSYLFILITPYVIGMTYTPIAPTVLLPYDEAQLWIDDDNNAATGYGFGYGRMWRWCGAEPQHYQWCIMGPQSAGGWGDWIGLAAATGLGTTTPIIPFPLGGSTKWAFETYVSGRLSEKKTGTKSGTAFAVIDNAAMIWCLNGPGVAYPLGCGVFDEDSDGDVDLFDWSKR